MTDRPILFSAPMVRAMIARHKTQTRRIIPAGNIYEDLSSEAHEDFELRGWRTFSDGDSLCAANIRASVGDRLYVREHWRTWRSADDVAPRDLQGGMLNLSRASIWYEATPNDDKSAGPLKFETGKHRQAMHMPRWASRLTLIVTDIRIERLQEISEADAIAEGVERDCADGCCWRNPADGALQSYHGPVNAYAALWESINGPGSWDKNPWVLVVTFDPIAKNIDEVDR